jgi:pyruvate,water dikinase
LVFPKVWINKNSIDNLVIPFEKIGIEEVLKRGGKNASLREMYQKLTFLGVWIPNGFALTFSVSQIFVEENQTW